MNILDSLLSDVAAAAVANSRNIAAVVDSGLVEVAEVRPTVVSADESSAVYDTCSLVVADTAVVVALFVVS